MNNWTATVTIYKDGERVTILDLTSVTIIESGSGDLDPETGLPVEADPRLCVEGVIVEHKD